MAFISGLITFLEILMLPLAIGNERTIIEAIISFIGARGEAFRFIYVYT